MDLIQRLRNYDAGIDLSITLREETSWKSGILNQLTLPRTTSGDHDISAMAVDPCSGLLAIGTSAGYIHLCGSPPVTAKLKIPHLPNIRSGSKTAARFLAFAPALQMLICVASADKVHGLHLWELAPKSEAGIGPPKLVRSLELPRPITGITVSPSLSHIFLAAPDGEIMTYDLERFCFAPYVVPNAWITHEERMRKSGLLDDLPNLEPPMFMDMVVHPRDLNKLFIVYEGGVVLWDVNNREISRVYQLTLHPGAEGGGSYNEEALYTERHPLATCISIHPSGHLFAVGHFDGCISFWAVDDEDRPLAVKTLSDPFSFTDVHIPDPANLLDDSKSRKVVQREPIFKLSWSALHPNRDLEQNSTPKAASQGAAVDDQVVAFSDTALVALGGGLETDPQGVMVLQFPPLTLPKRTEGPGSPTAQGVLQPSIRNAMKASLFPIAILDDSDNPLELSSSKMFYPVQSVAEDFILIPQASPHFHGTYDPIGIIILSSSTYETQKEKSCLDAFDFPPRQHQSDGPPKTGFQRARLPVSLSLSFPGESEVINGAQVLKLDSRETFGRLVKGWVTYGDRTRTVLGGRLASLDGGSAEPNFSGEDPPDRRLAKWDSHRMMITHHRDLTVRFYDISTQLLVSAEKVEAEYPQILPNLTIDLAPVVELVELDRSPANDSTTVSAPIGIQSVELVQQALECVVVLDTGDVAWYKFKQGGAPTHIYSSSDQDLDSSNILPLDPLISAAERRRDCFHPICLIQPPHEQKGTEVAARVVACAASDIGFLAIAYSNDTLAIVDIRGPRMLSKVQWKDTDAKIGPIVSLKWAISGLGSDVNPAVRLVVAHKSGTIKIITFEQEGATKAWIADPRPYSGNKEHRRAPDFPEMVQSSLEDPIAVFVLDGKSGEECGATPTLLQKAMIIQEQEDEPVDQGKGVPSHCFLVVAARKEVRCYRNAIGERVGRAEWPGKGAGIILRVQVINRNGYQVLVVFMQDSKAIVYSLPALELLHTFDMPLVSTPTSIMHLHCDSGGDYVQLLQQPSSPADQGRSLSLTLSTLLKFRRPSPPLVDFGGRPAFSTSTQPKPISLQDQATGIGGTIGSYIWGGGKKVFNGAEIDAILGGPNRPPPPAPAPVKPKVSTRAAEGSASPSRSGRVLPANPDEEGVFARLRNAAAERGEVLSQLGEQVGALESSSRDMVSQAKRIAAQQSAKRWLFG